ncbi:unnamed protein product, partial [Heterosigma akashiwo]
MAYPSCHLSLSLLTSFREEAQAATSDTMAEYLAKANILLINEHLEDAISIYGKALEQDGQLLDALTGRAAANLLTGQMRAALQDSIKAIAVDTNCEVAYYRKGVAAFHLEEYETAQEAFQKGQELYQPSGSDQRKYKTWLRKCEAE